MRRPASLISQAAARTSYDPDRGNFKVAELPAGVWVAGDVAGQGLFRSAADSGERAGLEAAHALGLGEVRSRARTVELTRQLDGEQEPAVAVPPASAANGSRGKAFACFCEDVTAKDIKLSVAEGYDSIELCKRYTTVTMGPCQGRMCQLPAIRLMARETGQNLEAGRDHDGAASVVDGPAGRAGRAPDRAGQALVDSGPPPRARRGDPLGRRLGTPIRLRRPRGRGAECPHRSRPDRRLDARQAARARP